MGRTGWALALLALLCAARGVAAARFLGNVTVDKSWQVLAHFAVDSAGLSGVAGTVQGTIKVEHNAVLVMYDDSEASWPRLQTHHAVTCAQAVKTIAEGGFAVHSISLIGGHSNSFSHALPGKPRASVWQFAVARCASGGGGGGERRRELASLQPTSVSRPRFHKYHAHRYHAYHASRYHHLGRHVPKLEQLGRVSMDLHIVSESLSGGWASEFPADEVLLLPGSMGFLVVYLVLCGFVAQELLAWRRRASSDTFMTSLLVFHAVAAICAVETLSLLLSLVELSHFASTGVERIDKVSLMRLVSSLLSESARIATVLLLAVLSTGWMILSPRLRDIECVAQFGWLLVIVYLIATFGTFLLSTSPNFTDEYHGLLWIFVLVAESMVLIFSLSYAAHTLLFSDRLGVKGANRHLGRTTSAYQTHMRFRALLTVALVALAVLVVDWLLALLSASTPGWERIDMVFVLSTGAHALNCMVLLLAFRPARLQLLQSTRAAKRETQAAWKAQEYGEDDADLDFEGMQPFIK